MRARLERAARFRDFFEGTAQHQLALEDAEAPEDEAEADEEVEKARMSDARRKLQRSVMVAVEEWYLDMMVCKQLSQPEGLKYPDERSILQEQAEQLPEHAIQKILQNIHKASRRMEGNLQVQVILEQFVF